MARRKDNKGRNLREGESQRADGRYMFRYIDLSGERQTEYSWRLVETDPHPEGKKKDLSLREKEDAINRDLNAGINISAATITLNELIQKYLRTKKKIADNVRDTYELQYKKHIESSFIGNSRIKDISVAPLSA